MRRTRPIASLFDYQPAEEAHMKHTLNVAKLAAAVGALLTATAVLADGSETRFSHFTPLAASAGPTADESMPITFGNPAFKQRSIADRVTQLADGKPNSGNWDMNTFNETQQLREGEFAWWGRYLFTVFETGQAGVLRHDLFTGKTETIWHSPDPGGH